MPQGTVITVRPTSFTGERSLLEAETESTLTTREGEVQIMDGEFAGETAYFKQQGNWVTIKEGESVDINIIGKKNGKIRVELHP